MKNLIPFTRKLFLPILLVCSCHVLFASDKNTDSLKNKISISAGKIDSLKKQVQITTNDSLKGPIYTEIAHQYLKYDTISNKKTRTAYQESVLSNTMSAIHYYSRYNDTTGLRTSFDDLAHVYHAQHKYTQAKWFILQSNSLSRDKNDNPNIIASLIELASIKTDIKDYSLAMRDLKEALVLSSKKHYPQQESEVELGYAMLYRGMKNYAKANTALKRHRAIDDSIKKAEEAALMAKIKAADSVQQAKKKVYMTSSKRLYVFNSSKKPDSLQFFYLSSF